MLKKSKSGLLQSLINDNEDELTIDEINILKHTLIKNGIDINCSDYGTVKEIILKNKDELNEMIIIENMNEWNYIKEISFN